MRPFCWVIIFALISFANSEVASARASRVLKFSGIPQSMAPAIKKRFPFVFEREVSLSEIDEVVRFLMKTGGFANVEAVERTTEDGIRRETVILASVLRRIQDIAITGNRAHSTANVLKVLGLEKGQVFERKHLLAAAEELRKIYESTGYHNARVEIDFEIPNESEVKISVNIVEGNPVVVSDVIIDSTNTDLAEKLAKRARSLREKVLTDDELLEFQKSVGEFLVKNRYLTARLSTPAIALSPDRTQAKLTYVVENPWKFEFQLEGNTFFTDYRIISQLEEEKLSGAVSSPAPDMAEKIRRLYHAHGYANAEVSHSEKLSEDSSTLKLQFNINEGRRVRIKKVEIEGSVTRPSDYYARLIRDSSSDLVKSGVYNRKEFEDGTKNLVTELQNQGYLRAKVVSQRVEYSEDKSSVTIHVAIDEGPLTQIRQIRFEGVESFPKAQLAELLKIKTGAALGLGELEESITALKNFYHSEGFLEMRILNENEHERIVSYNDGNTQATVEFRIYEGPRVIVGTISTQGNTFTKDHVITRELAFKTGDVLTPEKIDESVYRLQKLGLFSGVTLRMLEEGTNIAERTIIIELTEDNPGSIIIRVGGTNERQHLTFRGAAGISYRNIYGTGRGVSFRVDPKYSTNPDISYIEHTMTLSYLEPYIFNDRNRGRIDVVREQQFLEVDEETKRTIIAESNSVSLLLERDLTRHVHFTYMGYSIANQREFDRDSFATRKVQNIAKTGPLLEFDFRDDVFNPTKGIYSYLNLEYSDPILGSSQDIDLTIHFFKATAGFTRYQPLLGRNNLVWVNQIRGGYLANISDQRNAGVPHQEAFFLGGRSTIRGFDAGSDDERIPNKHDLNVDSRSDFRVRHDSYFGLFKTELWFPVYKQLGGSIFYDGGAVFVNQTGVNIGDAYRDSVGVGIRVNTPVGPVNVEFGWKLDRRLISVGENGQYDNRESPSAWHLSIGSL